MPPLHTESDQFRAVRANASNAMIQAQQSRQAVEELLSSVKSLNQRVMSLEASIHGLVKNLNTLTARMVKLETKLKVGSE